MAKRKKPKGQTTIYKLSSNTNPPLNTRVEAGDVSWMRKDHFKFGIRTSHMLPLITHEILTLLKDMI